MKSVYLVVRKDNFYPLAVFSSIKKAQEELPNLVFNQVITGTDFLVQEFPVDPTYKTGGQLDNKISYNDIDSSVVRGSQE